jgi:hypothetical protein
MIPLEIVAIRQLSADAGKSYDVQAKRLFVLIFLSLHFADASATARFAGPGRFVSRYLSSG